MMRWTLLFGLLMLVMGCQPHTIPSAKEQSTQYFLVRHAEKGQDDPKDPTLTATGEARAQLLARELSQAGIRAIYSTDYQRTRLTAQPLADRLGLEVQIYDAKRDLGEFLHEVQSTHAGDKVLIVGHSNTIPNMANILSGKESYQQFDDADYNHLLIVTGMLGQGVVTDLTISPCLAE
ncbi:MAG: phosphoglycerate mutase family protein [Saprospiraceae bacterium]